MKYLKNINKNTIVFPIANILASVLKVVAGILNAKLLAPYLLGMFNAIGLSLGYVTLAHGGLLTGLNRELPFFIGTGDKKKAYDLAAVSEFWAILIGIISFVILTFISAYYFIIKSSVIEGAGWFSFAIVSFLTIYSIHYLQVLYRTNNDFNKLAYIRIGEAVLNLILVLLVVYYSFYGMCLRLILITLLSAFLLFIFRPIKVKPKFSMQDAKHLFNIGVPIFIVSQIYLLWPIINSTLIANILGFEALGLFYIADMVGKNIEILPSSISQITYPKMAMAYGEGKSEKDIIMIAAKPILLLTLFLIVINILAVFILPLLIEYFVPKYVDGIQAALIMMVFGSLKSLEIMNNSFNVFKRQKQYFLSICLGVLIYICCLYCFSINSELTLVDFAYSMLIGKIGYISLSYFFILRILRKEN